MKQIKIFFALAVVMIAVGTTAFTGNNKNLNGVHSLVTDPEWVYFQFTGLPGEEDDHTKYMPVNISSPSELSCLGDGTVCVIRALRVSPDENEPGYNIPQFDVDPETDFPYDDDTKVEEVIQKAVN